MRRALSLVTFLFLVAALFAALFVVHQAEATVTYGSGRGAAAGAAGSSRRTVSFSFALPSDTTYTSITPGLAVTVFGAGTTSGISGPSRAALRHAVAAVASQTRGATSSTILTRTDWNPTLTASGVIFNGPSSGGFLGFDDGTATGSCTLGGGAVWTNVFQAGTGTCTAVALLGAHVIMDSRGTSTGKPMCCAEQGGNWTCANILSVAVGAENYTVKIALTAASVTCTLTNVDLPGVREGSATVSTNLPAATTLLRLTSGLQSFGGGTVLQVGGIQIDNPY